MDANSRKQFSAARSPAERLGAWVRWCTQTAVWGMEVDRTCWIEASAYIDRTWPKGIHVGAETYVGEEAVVLTHDYTRGVYLDTRIGARCIIGARAIIMPGCSIGDDCIVAPGAVVTKDMTSGCEAHGNPAQIQPRQAWDASDERSV